MYCVRQIAVLTRSVVVNILLVVDPVRWELFATTPPSSLYRLATTRPLTHGPMHDAQLGTCIHWCFLWCQQLIIFFLVALPRTPGVPMIQATVFFMLIGTYMLSNTRLC